MAAQVCARWRVRFRDSKGPAARRAERHMTEDTLARWRAKEQAVRARLAAPGYVRPEQVRGRTGLETLQAIFSGELPSPPIGETPDFVPIRMDVGVAVFQGRPQLKHYNPLGAVHGGWFA